MKKRFLAVVFYTLMMAVPRVHAESEVRKLEPFSEISLRVSANLFIEQGEGSQVEITAKQETLDKIIIEVTNHKLVIRYSIEDMLFSNFDPGKVTIKVTTSDVEMLSVAGSGNIIAEKTINTRIIELFIAGSGNIKLSDLICERMEAEITGSGDIVVSGSEKVKEIKLLIAGSGNLKANQLKADYGKIRIAGSGNCDIDISELLDAKILGSGNIRYEGNPTIDSMISGSGKIQKIQ